MIGFISSADQNGDFKNITLSVWDADDFAIMDFESDKQVWTVNRYTGFICPVSAQRQVKRIDTTLVAKLVNHLKAYEISEKLALELSWRSYGVNAVEILSSEYMEDVWLPVSVINDAAKRSFINVTGLFFKHSPKILEVSLVCDMLNLLASATGIKMANPFVCVCNTLFCALETMKVLKKLFGRDLFSFECMKNIKDELENSGTLKKTPKIIFNVRNVICSLESFEGTKTLYDGNGLYFLVGAKRDCFLSLVRDFRIAIQKSYGLKRFAVLFSKHISTALNRIRSLGEILVVKDHIERLGDINYLTLYELTECFAFNEKSLELKNTVRKSAKRMRIVKNLKVPGYILQD